MEHKIDPAIEAIKVPATQMQPTHQFSVQESIKEVDESENLEVDQTNINEASPAT